MANTLIHSFTVSESQSRCRDCGSLRLIIFMQVYFYCLSCHTLQAEIEKVKGENTDRNTTESSQLPVFGFGDE
jgi:hypothetical protein